jgi:hypothetical protein
MGDKIFLNIKRKLFNSIFSGFSFQEYHAEFFEMAFPNHGDAKNLEDVLAELSKLF